MIKRNMRDLPKIKLQPSLLQLILQFNCYFITLHDKDMEKRIVFFEVKRNKKRISLPLLKQKANNIMNHFSGYITEYKGLSMEDM